MSKLLATLGRCLADRHHYQSSIYWGVALYDRLLRRYASMPIPFRGRRFAYRIKGLDRAIVSRLGSSDSLVMSEIFFNNEYGNIFDCLEPDEVKTIVDLGANCGYSVMLWSDRFPNARILAVEPDMGNVSVLKENNEPGITSGKISVASVCVGGTDRWGSLDRSQAEWAYKLIEGPVVDKDTVVDKDVVQVKSLDRLLEDAGLRGEIDLLKCDIEGSERELMESCERWLDKVRFLLIEVHEPYTAAELTLAVQRSTRSFSSKRIEAKGGTEVFLFERL